MLGSDKRALKGLCYIVSLPLGMIAFKAFIFSLPYLGMLAAAFIIANTLMYWLNA